MSCRVNRSPQKHRAVFKLIDIETSMASQAMHSFSWLAWLGAVRIHFVCVLAPRLGWI